MLSRYQCQDIVPASSNYALLRGRQASTLFKVEKVEVHVPFIWSHCEKTWLSTVLNLY